MLLTSSQVGVCHAQEQSHGSLASRHDRSICRSYVDRSVLFRRVPLRIMDVSIPCIRDISELGIDSSFPVIQSWKKRPWVSDTKGICKNGIINQDLGILQGKTSTIVRRILLRTELP